MKKNEPIVTCPLTTVFIGCLIIANKFDSVLSLFSKKKSDQDAQDPDEESKHLGGMPLRA